MQLDEALAQLQASLDLALARPGCMAVVSPHALAVLLAQYQNHDQGKHDGQN